MERFTNGAKTTLTANVGVSDTSISVADTSGFPSGGNFRIVIDTEILIVTAVAGTTFTVTRGAESTTAATHTSSAKVTQILTSGSLSQAIKEGILIGTVADISDVGRLFIPANDPVLGRTDGTKYVSYGPLFKFKPPPVLSTLTFYGVNPDYVEQNALSAYIEQRPNGTGGFSGWTMPVTIPYTFTIGFIKQQFIDTRYQSVNIFITDSVHSKTINCGSSVRDDGFNYNEAERNNFPANYQNGVYLTKMTQKTGLVEFYRIVNDGTNRMYQTSVDGTHFVTLGSTSNTDWLTEAEIGLSMVNNTASLNGCNLLHWELK